MKIIDEIVGLVKEHHQSLVLANKCINTAKLKNEINKKTMCEKVHSNFAKDFSNHFLIEENFVFQPLLEKNTPSNNLIKQLTKEHQILLQLAKDINKNNDLLEEFGILLKTHTRLEDRELFPQLTKYLNTEQLHKIQQNYD